MKRITKICIILIIEFTILLLSFILYWPPFNEDKISTIESSSNYVTFNLNEFNFDEPTFLNMLRKVTYPFNSKYYEVYIQTELPKNQFCSFLLKSNYTIEYNNVTRDFNLHLGEKEHVDTLKIDKYFIQVNSPILELVISKNLSDYFFNKSNHDFNNYTLGNFNDYGFGNNDTYENNEIFFIRDGGIICNMDNEIAPVIYAKTPFWDAVGNMLIFFLVGSGIVSLFISLTEWITKNEL